MTELDDAKETTRRLGKIGDELITMLVDVSDGALTGKLAEAAVVIGVAEVAAEAWADRLEMAQAAQAAMLPTCRKCGAAVPPDGPMQGSFDSAELGWRCWDCVLDDIRENVTFTTPKTESEE